MRRLSVLLAIGVLAAGCGATKQASGPEVALLIGVTVTGQDVRFEFGSPPREVRTRFVPAGQLAESGSGARVRLRGGAFVVVTFTPAATADLRGEHVVPVYRGPRRIRPPARGPVREVVKIGDFEAQLDWAVGLDRRRAPHVVRDGSRVTVTFGA